MDTGKRVKTLAHKLQEQSVDAFFAHNPISMGYLVGNFEDPHLRFTTIAINSNGDVVAIAPALSEVALRKIGLSDVRVWKDGEDPIAIFSQLAAEWSLKSGVLAVDTTLPAHMLLKMQNALPAALFQDGQPILGAIMAQKDHAELDMLRKAGAIADEVFKEILGFIKPGLTELDVEEFIFRKFKEKGSEPYFAIIGAGPNGAEPHHLSDNTVLKSGDVVVCDFGCDLEGYKSDITRMVSLGKASEEVKAAYELVYKAHMAARAAIKPGVAGQEIDRAARKVIVDAGHGDAFFHRLGHGIGMNGHEDPYMVEGNTVPLEVGNCFSIEPGVYFGGKFGIRIENIVTVTADGHASLNDEPSPTLIEI